MDVSLKDIFLCALPVLITTYYELKKEKEASIMKEVVELKQIIHDLQESEHTRASKQQQLVAMFERMQDSFIVIQDKIEKLENLSIAMTKDRIVQSCTFFIEKQKWIPPNIYGNLAEMHSAYASFGKNGEATCLFDEVSKLPKAPPEGTIT